MLGTSWNRERSQKKISHKIKPHCSKKRALTKRKGAVSQPQLSHVCA